MRGIAVIVVRSRDVLVLRPIGRTVPKIVLHHGYRDARARSRQNTAARRTMTEVVKGVVVELPVVAVGVSTISVRWAPQHRRHTGIVTGPDYVILVVEDVAVELPI